jgi:hypothetical protein
MWGHELVDLAQDRDRWQALVNTAINCRSDFYINILSV